MSRSPTPARSRSLRLGEGERDFPRQPALRLRLVASPSRAERARLRMAGAMPPEPAAAGLEATAGAPGVGIAWRLRRGPAGERRYQQATHSTPRSTPCTRDDRRPRRLAPSEFPCPRSTIHRSLLAPYDLPVAPPTPSDPIPRMLRPDPPTPTPLTASPALPDFSGMSRKGVQREAVDPLPRAGLAGSEISGVGGSGSVFRSELTARTERIEGNRPGGTVVISPVDPR